jgi:hypothetical protein
MTVNRRANSRPWFNPGKALQRGHSPASSLDYGLRSPSCETVRARAAYQDFLTLWKDADPDIPILKQAKAEYAEMQ